METKINKLILYKFTPIQILKNNLKLVNGQKNAHLWIQVMPLCPKTEKTNQKRLVQFRFCDGPSFKELWVIPFHDQRPLNWFCV